MADQQQDVCTLHDFERNRYFYGKLLTVRDFETEQSYFRGKDALINRIVHGGGMICGLEISNLSEDPDTQKLTANLSAGVAIDCCGREIIVSKSGTVNIVGQLQEGSANYLYLEYKECDKEPVPVPANASTCEEKCDYNRIKETFTVTVSAQAPSTTAEDYYKQFVNPTTCFECEVQGEAGVLLAVVDKNLDGTITVNESLTDQYRVLLPSNPMLYALLDAHTSDFDNPHHTTAEQVGALESVDGVGRDANGDVDLISANSIHIHPAPADHTITIGEDHSPLQNNPHHVTAAQVGALATLDGVDGDANGNVDLISANSITFLPTPADHTITISENHSPLQNNPHNVTVTQVGAIGRINGVSPDANSNLNLVAGNNITITPNQPDIHSITISAAGGTGLEEGLTTIEGIKWEHAGEMQVADFINGLELVFSGPVRLETIPGNIPPEDFARETFLVAAKIPLNQESRFGVPITTYHYEYLPGKVELGNDQVTGRFELEDAAMMQEFLQQVMQQAAGRLTILVQLKCDFIIDGDGRAVDGHHFRGTGQSGLIRDNGNVIAGIRGGVFESWFYLVQETGPIPPAIILNPSGGPVGTTVRVAGTNFDPNEVVQVDFGPISGIVQVDTTTTGSFNASFGVPTVSSGTVNVRAIGLKSQRVAQAAFTVTTQIIPIPIDIDSIRPVLVDTIRENPQIGMRRLGEMLDTDQETLGNTLEGLTEEGVIKRDRRGRYTIAND